MKINNEVHEQTGRFFIEENNSTVAEMDYRFPVEDTLLIVHTEVDDKLEGQGIGKELVKAAVTYAREKHLRLTATCSYARKVLDRSPEYADVYHPENK
jgi:predicted GNAT family acetyltransferase